MGRLSLLLPILLLITSFASGQGGTDSVFTIVEYPAHPASGSMIEWQKSLLAKVPIESHKSISDYLSCWRPVVVIVEKDGALTWVDAPKCTDQDIREAIRRVIEEAPPFIPARHHDKTVRQRIQISFSCIKLN